MVRCGSTSSIEPCRCGTPWTDDATAKWFATRVWLGTSEKTRFWPLRSGPGRRCGHFFHLVVRTRCVYAPHYAACCIGYCLFGFTRWRHSVTSTECRQGANPRIECVYVVHTACADGRRCRSRRRRGCSFVYVTLLTTVEMEPARGGRAGSRGFGRHQRRDQDFPM